MSVTIGRRQLIAAFGGAAVVLPSAARARPAAMPLVDSCIQGRRPIPGISLRRF
jgi:hypothetical protein